MSRRSLKFWFVDRLSGYLSIRCAPSTPELGSDSLVKVSRELARQGHRGANAGTPRNDIGQVRGPSHLFNVPGSPLLPLFIHSRFSRTHSLSFSFFLCFIARSLRQGGRRF